MMKEKIKKISGERNAHSKEDKGKMKGGVSLG